MHIRPARSTDVAAIARVHVDSWRTTYEGIVPGAFLAQLSYRQRAQLWQSVLACPAPNTAVYVAADASGDIVGFASAGPERSGKTTYVAELYAIYILQSYQGQGIGRQLMAAVAKRLVEAGMTSLLLWVLAANPSRRFYEALGGQPVSEKTVTIGGVPLLEVSYGWPDVHRLLGEPPGDTSAAP
jgi:GNAT superfamily N-acetyltransferase